MNNYCCQIHSLSGRILEIFYEDFFDALNKCAQESQNKNAKLIRLFNYPNMNVPVCVMRIL